MYFNYDILSMLVDYIDIFGAYTLYILGDDRYKSIISKKIECNILQYMDSELQCKNHYMCTDTDIIKFFNNETINGIEEISKISNNIIIYDFSKKNEFEMTRNLNAKSIIINNTDTNVTDLQYYENLTDIIIICGRDDLYRNLHKLKTLKYLIVPDINYSMPTTTCLPELKYVHIHSIVSSTQLIPLAIIEETIFIKNIISCDYSNIIAHLSKNLKQLILGSEYILMVRYDGILNITLEKFVSMLSKDMPNLKVTIQT